MEDLPLARYVVAGRPALSGVFESMAIGQRVNLWEGVKVWWSEWDADCINRL